MAADLTEEPSWRFDPAESAVDDLQEVWLRQIYAPYLKDYIDLYGAVSRKLTCTWTLVGVDVSREFVFDQTFLKQAMETYAAHGWAALEIMRDKAASTQHPATRTFVEATLWVVSVGISRELVRIEGRAMELALKQWKDGLEKLRTYTKEFESIGAGGYKFKHQFRDREKGKQVFRLCAEYARQLRKFEKFQKAMDERNRKDRYDPAKRPNRANAQELWYELYAGPQREVYQAMSDIVQQLGATAPAAVLALADLPPDLWKPVASEQGEDYWNRARPLDDKIYATLVQLSDDVAVLLDSLGKPGQVGTLNINLTKPASPPPGGSEAVVVTAALKAGAKDNRVMADVGLMQGLLQEVEEERAVSWEHAVLKRYYLYLCAEVDKKKLNQEDWNVFWGWVGRIGAALSLLALLAVFPFSGPAVAPAIVTLLSIISVAAVSVVVITLVVNLFHLFTEEKAAAANDLREQMFKLGQSDPEALLEVGTVLHRNQEIRAAMTTGLLLTLFKLALAGKIRVIALALELEGFLGDMETLFGAPVIYSE